MYGYLVGGIASFFTMARRSPSCTLPILATVAVMVMLVYSSLTINHVKLLQSSNTFNQIKFQFRGSKTCTLLYYLQRMRRVCHAMGIGGDLNLISGDQAQEIFCRDVEFGLMLF